MTTGATARHRASDPPTTPLSLLGSAVSEQVSTHVSSLGRGGAVLAMSSGLIATVGLPAQAVARNFGIGQAPATIASGLALQDQLAANAVAAPAEASAPLTASSGAKVQFETTGFSAVPVARPAVRHVVAKVTSTSHSSSSSRQVSFPTGGFNSAKGSSVISVAARYLGVPYRYGGTTPSGWDCSGAMGYIFRQVGVSLPRTANEQMLFSKRISRSEARAGDLVFFLSGGRAYHVGLYAGNGMMYDAGHTGVTFRYRDVYTATVVFGRVL